MIKRTLFVMLAAATPAAPAERRPPQFEVQEIASEFGIGYALVYPAAMIAKILLAQLLAGF